MQRTESIDSVDTTETNNTFPEVDFLRSTSYEAHTKDTVTEFRQREIDGLFDEEPLLKEDKSRFVLFPIEHSDVSI